MSDEEVLNLLADSKISVSPESEKEKYTLGQRAADVIAKFAGSWAFIFSVYSAEFGVVLCGGNSGAAYYDESEPAGGKGSTQSGK